jgi:hypothetical protein
MSVRPYDLYIRFLCTKGVNSLESANEQLKTLDLPTIAAKTFEKQYNLVQDTLPVGIIRQIESKSYTPDFIKWMKAIDVAELWGYERAFRSQESSNIRLVYDLHTDHLLRLTLNALLIKSKNFDEIAQEVNLKFSSLLKAHHVELYKKYFWDVERMTRNAWRELLRDLGDDTRAILLTALTEDINILKAMLELPTRAALGDSLQYLFVQAFRKAKFYLKLDTPDTNGEAREWIKMVMSLADKYDKHSTGDAKDFGKQLQMEFEFLDGDFPTPDKVTLDGLQQELKEKELKSEAESEIE